MEHYYVFPESSIVIYNSATKKYTSSKFPSSVTFSAKEFIEYQFQKKVYVFNRKGNLFYVNEKDVQVIS